MGGRAVLLFLVALLACGQIPLRVDKDLVLVPVTVYDRSDRAMPGLEREHFRVFDDNVEQTVSQFWMDDEPLAIGFVFDTSASMETKLSRAREAATAFFQASNEEDEFLLIEFNNRPRLSVPLTHDTGELAARLALARAQGRTALVDAVYLGVQEIRKSSMSRKALIVVSDGGDNASRYRANELKRLVRESDVLIYGIGIYQPGLGRITAGELRGPNLLAEIAQESGGRAVEVDRLDNLPDVAGKIGLELRNRYVLGFSPPPSQRDGRYHRLQIKLTPPRELPPMRAHWRAGYYAPVQ